MDLRGIPRPTHRVRLKPFKCIKYGTEMICVFGME